MAIFCGVFIAISPIFANELTLKKVTFITHWSPQAQFAGYYVAKAKGFYSRHGLDVEILPSGSNISASQALADGRADFAILWLSQALQKRSEGIGLVDICQIVQQSGLMFLARSEDGICVPQDLDGKKISLWSGDLRLQGEAFINKYGLDVKKIPQGYTVNLFLAGGVDAIMAMWYNEYNTIVNCGVDPESLCTFFFKDHVINVPEDGIYVLEKRYRENPEVAKAFVEASVKGWLYAFTHQDEAVEIVLDRMRDDKIPANSEHQRWMLSSIKDFIIPNNDVLSIGYLSPNDYKAVTAMLKGNGLIENVVPFDSFYVPLYEK